MCILPDDRSGVAYFIADHKPEKTMTKKTLRFFIFTASLFVVSAIALAWGSWGHKHISRAAVFALPEEMRLFYYNHIDYITESSVVPDLRRPLLADKAEGPRHFLDVEDFNVPLGDIARTAQEAYQKYDSAFLSKTGILPWYIEELMQKLTRAFEKKNKSEILFLSSELAHYIADAHMPLHTSSNYNGQLSGQKGVHALWETTLPQMFGNDFNFHTAPPRYIDDVTDFTWKMIAQSHSLVKPLLAAEMAVRNRFDSTNMYRRDEHGQLVLFYNNPVFSKEYATAFQKQLGNMVEDQLRLSIYDISCYWYTAWVNGGKPNLLRLDDPHLTKQNRRNYRKEYKAWKKGKILNLKIERE